MKPKIPSIIMLHHVGDDSVYSNLKPYAISKETFLQLLDTLEQKKIQTLTFADLLTPSRIPFNRKQVIITFDDCSKSLLEFAVPELIKRQMKAVFYMPTAHLGLDNAWDVAEGRSRLELMDAQDLVFLAQSGMEIGSHAHQHIKLDQVPMAEALQEVSTSKSILEGIIQQPVVSLAYPYGAIPDSYKQILKTAGIAFGLGIYTPVEDSFSLRRFIYHDGDTERTLRLKLSDLYRMYRSISDRFKHY